MKAIFFLFVMILLSGCSHVSKSLNPQLSTGERKLFVLKEITPEQGRIFLSQLGLTTVSILPEGNAVIVTGSEAELKKAGVLLDLVDTKEDFIIEVLTPVSIARTVPTNDQIAEALGDITIGMFANPPKLGEYVRAIVDIHGESVVAIIPARFQREVLAFVKFGPDGLRRLRGETEEPAKAEDEAAQESVKEQTINTDHESDKTAVPPVTEEVASSGMVSTQDSSDSSMPHVSDIESDTQMKNQLNPATTTDVVVVEKTEASDKRDLESEIKVDSEDEQQSTTHIVTQDPAHKTINPAKTEVIYELAPLANGEDILELDLPEKLEMIQLLDLVAEYLNLVCIYDPQKIRGQIISLRLHGQQQGGLRVKDLYPLLESVLKFKGFAMTCHKGNLVTIVPLTDALDVDPALLDPNGDTIRAGDMVVTRMFNLQYIKTSSAMNLLDNMKLGVITSPIEETQTIIVTCYAHRMSRIERLLSMADRPGRPKEFRYRQLKYTKAQSLTKKVETLVAELQTIPVRIAPIEKRTSPLALKVDLPSRLTSQKSREISNTDEINRYTVFLDADERTDRILMIGHTEQLVIVEEVIDTLDVATHDPRNLRVYDIIYLNAADVEKKLKELEVISKLDQATSTPSPVLISKTSPTGTAEGTNTIEPTTQVQTQVTVLEATNSLLCCL